jgi:glycosyltransferase involved in cell wall biosynthesis
VAPDVSVVISTKDRPERLARQLEKLRAQTLDPERFEVIVVDDGSGPETAAMLEREAVAWPALRLIRRETSAGPATGRNEGWLAARGDLVAFTDDDCEATPTWLESLVRAAGEHPGAILQGRILPIPAEEPSFGPFSHTIRIEELSRGFETANIAYPRALLERLGGFDETSYSKPGGEDTDLAWTAIDEGVEAVFVADALAYHAVLHLGPLGQLRRAMRWDESVLAYKRHPALRKTLYLRVFWSPLHFQMLRAMLALALPRRLWWLRMWLAAPYVTHLVERRSGPLLAPYIVVRDGLEIATLVRGSLRYRTLVL